MPSRKLAVLAKQQLKFGVKKPAETLFYHRIICAIRASLWCQNQNQRLGYISPTTISKDQPGKNTSISSSLKLTSISSVQKSGKIRKRVCFVLSEGSKGTLGMQFVPPFKFGVKINQCLGNVLPMINLRPFPKIRKNFVHFFSAEIQKKCESACALFYPNGPKELEECKSPSANRKPLCRPSYKSASDKVRSLAATK